MADIVPLGVLFALVNECVGGFRYFSSLSEECTRFQNELDVCLSILKMVQESERPEFRMGLGILIGAVITGRDVLRQCSTPFSLNVRFRSGHYRNVLKSALNDWISGLRVLNTTGVILPLLSSETDRNRVRLDIVEEVHGENEESENLREIIRILDEILSSINNNPPPERPPQQAVPQPPEPPSQQVAPQPPEQPPQQVAPQPTSQECEIPCWVWIAGVVLTSIMVSLLASIQYLRGPHNSVEAPAVMTPTIAPMRAPTIVPVPVPATSQPQPPSSNANSINPCPSEYQTFNECVRSISNVDGSVCDSCVASHWPSNPSTCWELEDPTCAALSLCPSCNGCSQEYLNYLVCLSQGDCVWYCM